MQWPSVRAAAYTYTHLHIHKLRSLHWIVGGRFTAKARRPPFPEGRPPLSPDGFRSSDPSSPVHRTERPAAPAHATMTPSVKPYPGGISRCSKLRL